MAGCETGPLLHVHLVRERHYLLGPGSGKKPLWFPDTSLLLAVIDRDEPEPGKWLERFRLTFDTLPLVLITMRGIASRAESAHAQASEVKTSSRPTSRWHFAENSSPEVVARFITLAATPLEFGKTTLVCVDFADYLSALDGGGLIRVVRASGQGCEAAVAASADAVEKLRVMGASLEQASGAAIIVEISPRNTSAISLFDTIGNLIKISIHDKAAVLVSVPFNHDLSDDAFNLYLAVRE
ncbi:MAG: hypothetical protein ACREVE_13045 [Gammaproteobacteria bacterium]